MPFFKPCIKKRLENPLQNKPSPERYIFGWPQKAIIRPILAMGPAYPQFLGQLDFGGSDFPWCAILSSRQGVLWIQHSSITSTLSHITDILCIVQLVESVDGIPPTPVLKFFSLCPSTFQLTTGSKTRNSGTFLAFQIIMIPVGMQERLSKFLPRCLNSGKCKSCFDQSMKYSLSA